MKTSRPLLRSGAVRFAQLTEQFRQIDTARFPGSVVSCSSISAGNAVDKSHSIAWAHDATPR